MAVLGVLKKRTNKIGVCLCTDLFFTDDCVRGCVLSVPSLSVQRQLFHCMLTTVCLFYGYTLCGLFLATWDVRMVERKFTDAHDGRLVIFVSVFLCK